jgi:DNA-binding LacI/PurR family transcriptional regulator
LDENEEDMPSRHQPTSADVARKAGVSRATVSVVLNGTQGNMRVSAATRQKVLAVAAELGYSPHPVAQALRRRQSRVIGFVPRSFHKLPFVLPIPYLLSIYVAQAATALRYHVVEVDDASRSGDELVRFLRSRRVGGVIFDAPDTPEAVRRVIAGQPSWLGEGLVPIVQLMRPQFAAETPTITVDARRGIDAAIDHLVDLGHRRIAFIGESGAHPVDRARRDYFLAALVRHGLECPPDYFQLGRAYSLEVGYSCTQVLLGLPERPTALFTASDTYALGALRALYEADVRVPDRMSVVSYDDAFAGHLYPPLTSVTQPLKEVATSAVSLLIDSIESVERAKTIAQVVLPTHLTVRGSTAAVRLS